MIPIDHIFCNKFDGQNFLLHQPALASDWLDITSYIQHYVTALFLQQRCNQHIIHVINNNTVSQKMSRSQKWTLVDARLVCVEMFVAWKVESFVRCGSQKDDLKHKIGSVQLPEKTTQQNII